MTRDLTHEVNGPLLEFLAEYINVKDSECVNYFRSGAPLFNDGAELSFNECELSNDELIASMRRDENEAAVHEIAFEDW